MARESGVFLGLLLVAALALAVGDPGSGEGEGHDPGAHAAPAAAGGGENRGEVGKGQEPTGGGGGGGGGGGVDGVSGAADTEGSAGGVKKQAEGKFSAKDLEEEKEKKRAMLAEARAKFLKSEGERLAKEEEERKRHEAELRAIPVKFGSMISLRHETSRLLLASTNFKYYHTQTSGQHQVVAQAQEDGYTHWRVLPRAGHNWREVKDRPVRSGETIRLLSVRTERVLHSHASPAPVSGAKGGSEVTNFNGEDGTLDTNDNWIVHAQGGAEEWHFASNVTLQHAPSGTQLSVKEYEAQNHLFNFTFGHAEVSSTKVTPGGAEGTSLWWGFPSKEGEAGYDRHLALYETREEREERFTPPGADADNGPKEISIYCPQNPVVSVTDLDYNLVSEGKCFALNLQSPTFESKLTLNCDKKH